MDFFSGIVTYALPFLAILTALVFVHEMGHFLVARYNGVRVEVFSIGFGPELFGWTDRAKTRWKFSLIPLGGYVRMFGDANAASQPSNDQDEMTAEERAVSFPGKRLDQRAWIVAAGPLANFLFAVILLAGLFATIGQRFTPPVAGSITEDSAAAKAGILPGDRFVSIDGSAIERFEDVQLIIRLNPERPLELVMLRDGLEVVLTAVPTLTEMTDNFGNTQKIGLLGVSRSGVEYAKHDPLTAVWRAARETVSISVGTLQAVGQMIVGSRSTDELGGPLRIAQMSGQVTEMGFVTVIWFMAVLSVNLGLINLFPIPMLDGGHLLFYGIEAVRGRPLGERAQEYGFRFGLAMVLSLILFVTWNDLVHLEVIDFIRGLVT
ncbi:MAG: RIP metalloprotease RseP [Alphaproteobacteria bacterium]